MKFVEIIKSVRDSGSWCNYDTVDLIESLKNAEQIVKDLIQEGEKFGTAMGVSEALQEKDAINVQNNARKNWEDFTRPFRYLFERKCIECNEVLDEAHDGKESVCLKCSTIKFLRVLSDRVADGELKILDLDRTNIVKHTPTDDGLGCLKPSGVFELYMRFAEIEGKGSK